MSNPLAADHWESVDPSGRVWSGTRRGNWYRVTIGDKRLYWYRGVRMPWLAWAMFS